MTRASPATKARPCLSLVTLAPHGHTSSSSNLNLSSGPSTGSDASPSPDVAPPSLSSRMHATAPSKYSASALPPSRAEATMLYGCSPTVRTSELSSPRPGLATSHSRCRRGSAVSRCAISRAAWGG